MAALVLFGQNTAPDFRLTAEADTLVLRRLKAFFELPKLHRVLTTFRSPPELGCRKGLDIADLHATGHMDGTSNACAKQIETETHLRKEGSRLKQVENDLN